MSAFFSLILLRQGWSPVKGVLSTVWKINIFRFIVNESRPEDLIHQGRRINNIIENMIPNSWALGIDAFLVLISVFLWQATIQMMHSKLNYSLLFLVRSQFLTHHSLFLRLSEIFINLVAFKVLSPHKTVLLYLMKQMFILTILHIWHLHIIMGMVQKLIRLWDLNSYAFDNKLNVNNSINSRSR
jgi:hypothetical protein